MSNFVLIEIDWAAVGVAIAIVAAVLIWISLWRDRFRPLDWLLILLALGALPAALDEWPAVGVRVLP